MNEEELAYRLAKTAFDFHADPDDEWNERQDFKVPVLYYLALAREALSYMEEINVT